MDSRLRHSFIRLHAIAAMALAAANAGAAVTLEEGDPLLAADGAPLWSVKAGSYSAAVSHDGSIEIDAGGGALVKSLMLYRGNERVQTLDISRAGDDSISIREGQPSDAPAPDDLLGGAAEDAPAANVPGMKVVFRDDGIDVVPSGVPNADDKGNSPFTLYYGLGDAAIGVSNVILNVEDALPTWRFAEGHIFSFYEHLGNCWPDVDILGADGSSLSLRGITGIKPVRDFRIFAEDFARETPRGLAATVFAADRPISIAVSRAPAGAAKRAPVPPCSVSPMHTHGLYPAKEPARFALRFPDDAPAGRYRLEWSMVDHIQRPLGEGSATFGLGSGDTPSEAHVDIVPASAPPGYVYAEAWLSRDGEPSARRYIAFEFGRCEFENELLDIQPPWDINGEVYLMNVLGFRGIRLQASLPAIWLEFRDPDHPEQINWEGFKSKWRDLLAYCEMGSIKRPMMIMEGPGAREVEAYFRDTYGKPAPEGGEVPDLQLDEDAENVDPDKAWKDKRDEVMARWYQEFGAAAQELDLLWWEPWNEPDLQMPHEKYVETILKPIYDNFKKGGPDIDFLGGSCCGLEKEPWVARLYEVDSEDGAKDGRHFDGISFHPYTGVGFQRIYRMHLAQWWKLFADHGDDPSQGIFMTEAANHRGWGYNVYTYDRFRARRESYAHIGLHMMLHAEAFGIPRQRVYVFYACEHGYNDFFLVRRDSPTPSAIAFQVMNAALGESVFEKEVPLPGHDHFFQRFRGDGRTVAAMFTGGDTISVKVATDAPELTLTDCMGAAKRLEPVDGVVEVTFDNFPVFLAGPEGARLDPVYDGLEVRPNLALSALGAKASTEVAKDPGSPDIDVILDGDWTGFAGGCWNEHQDGAGPDGSGVFPDAFEVSLPEPRRIASVTVYHNYGAWERTLRDYDIEVFSGGGWKNVASVRGNYYSEVTTHEFEPVETDRVRLVVTGVNRCMFGEIPWIEAQTSLRAIEVHAAPERAAKAFFADGVLAKPQVDRNASFELEYRLVNATKSAVAGELRLVVPEGWSADPVAVKIPAGGEATVTAKVTAGENGGRSTVVASLCDADGAMISSDNDARVIEVR